MTDKELYDKAMAIREISRWDEVFAIARQITDENLKADVKNKARRMYHIEEGEGI